MNISKLLPFLISYRRWIAAVIIALAISFLVSAGHSRTQFQVVTAKHSIPVGSKLRDEDLQLKQIDFLWPQAITDIRTVSGAHATRRLSANEPISKSDVSMRKIYDLQNPTAVLITLPRSSSASDLPDGSRVDVYASTENGDAKRVVTNALVVNQHDQSGLIESGATISLAVSPEQVVRIASYDDTVRFTFAALASY